MSSRSSRSMDVALKGAAEAQDPFPLHTLVWATMDNQTWPGAIVDPLKYGFDEHKDRRMIFWFGDHRVSQMNIKKLEPFKDAYVKYCRRNYSRIWVLGVEEAIKEFGYPITEFFTSDEIFKYAKGGFDPLPAQRPPGLSEPTLNIIQRHHVINRMHVTEQTKLVYDKGVLLEVRRKKRDINTVCLACYSTEVAGEHPMFQGGICESCQDRFCSTFYVVGGDRVPFFCSICFCVGLMYICSNNDCKKVTCEKCINDLCAPGAKSWIKQSEPWYCFACDSKQEKRGMLILREDWQENLQALLNYNNTPDILIPPLPSVKKKLTVLSLFDGIATGYFVLKKLGYEIEKYYSCEIDPNALDVTSKNHPEIIQLGDVCDLTETKIQELGKIDLLIGGSPCNDFSLANPKRKGLYDETGTGILYFQYYRVWVIIQKLNNFNNTFFYLYENVASMTCRTKRTMCLFFNSQPKLIDAKFVSCQSRPRFFWGNIPALAQKQVDMNWNVSLQSHLDEGRIAKIPKLQTVTTQSNSLRQGQRKKMPIYDLYRDEYDVPNVEELEKMFGFPPGYTCVAGISDTKRRKLLGKCWSVQVIEQLFQSLHSYFTITDSDDDN